jgi:hypothetical protein
MTPNMQRPAATNDGPQQKQPGQRLDTHHSNDAPRCTVEYCTSTRLIVSLGGLWCPEHATQFIDELHRRVARRAAGLPHDAVVGLGIFQRPTSEDWPPSFAWLRCDMCPREWVGPQYEVCANCKRTLHDALEQHVKHHKQRDREANRVA